MGNLKTIPELRFPEFVNEGEWEEKRMDEIANVVASGDLDSNSFSSEKSTKHIYPIYSNSVSDEGLYGYNMYPKYKPNSVTITARGTLGVAFVRQTEFVGIGRLLVVSDLNNADAIFLKENWNHYAKVPLENGGIPQLTAVKAKSITLLFPKEKEQKKIASCLSSLDEVIAANSKKLELLKEHKKGLMQNLFPQEGITVPNYRFKEFENDGEWVNASIEKLINENVLFAPKDGNHGNIHPKSADYVKIGIPFIMASDIKNGKIDFSKCAFLKKEQADSLQKGFSKSGDVLLTHKGTVGEVALIGELEFPYIMLTPQVTYYRVKEKSKISNSYLFAFFNSTLFQTNLFNVSGGGTRAYVGITEQQKLKIFYPNKIEEQQKVADAFSSLNALIAAQAEKIEQLQMHKKGLMQSLFPKENN